MRGEVGGYKCGLGRLLAAPGREMGEVGVGDAGLDRGGDLSDWVGIVSVQVTARTSLPFDPPTGLTELRSTGCLGHLEGCFLGRATWGLSRVRGPRVP